MNMKVRSIWFSGCIFLSTTLTFGKEYKLWYNAPATVWEEALPIGNGRIGAMVMPREIMNIIMIQLFTSKKEKGQLRVFFFSSIRRVCL